MMRLTCVLRRSLAAFSLLCELAAVARADVIRGRVVGVADGDTITVLDASKSQHRIRLRGVDAPESRQAFGARRRAGARPAGEGRARRSRLASPPVVVGRAFSKWS